MLEIAAQILWASRRPVVAILNSLWPKRLGARVATELYPIVAEAIVFREKLDNSTSESYASSLNSSYEGQIEALKAKLHSMFGIHIALYYAEDDWMVENAENFIRRLAPLAKHGLANEIRKLCEKHSRHGT